jgi:hypothetical protein
MITQRARLRYVGVHVTNPEIGAWPDSGASCARPLHGVRNDNVGAAGRCCQGKPGCVSLVSCVKISPLTYGQIVIALLAPLRGARRRGREASATTSRIVGSLQRASVSVSREGQAPRRSVDQTRVARASRRSNRSRLSPPMRRFSAMASTRRSDFVRLRRPARRPDRHPGFAIMRKGSAPFPPRLGRRQTGERGVGAAGAFGRVSDERGGAEPFRFQARARGVRNPNCANSADRCSPGHRRSARSSLAQISTSRSALRRPSRGRCEARPSRCDTPAHAGKAGDAAAARQPEQASVSA